MSDNFKNKLLFGGGDIKKGKPPTATNYFGLLSNGMVERSKVNMLLEYPMVTIKGYFSANGSNPVFADEEIDMSGSTVYTNRKNVSVVVSGSGVKRDVDASFSHPLNTDPYGNVVTEITSTILGDVFGFKSDAEPYPTKYYAAFGRSIERDIEIKKTGSPLYPNPDSTIIDKDQWEQHGRQLRSKNISDMALPVNVNFNNLYTIKVVWIAGNNLNGGDKPDVHAFNNNNANSTNFITDGLKGDYRVRENLFIDFFNSENKKIGNSVTLWRTKRDLILPDDKDYAISLNGTINDVSENPWTPVSCWPTSFFVISISMKI